MRQKLNPKKAPGANLGQAMPAITKDKSTQEQDMQAPDHLGNLISAHHNMSESHKNITHLAKVHGLAGRPMKSVQDLKDHFQEAYGPKGQIPHSEPDADDDQD